MIRRGAAYTNVPFRARRGDIRDRPVRQDADASAHHADALIEAGQRIAGDGSSAAGASTASAGGGAARTADRRHNRQVRAWQWPTARNLERGRHPARLQRLPRRRKRCRPSCAQAGELRRLTAISAVGPDQRKNLDRGVLPAPSAKQGEDRPSATSRSMPSSTTWSTERLAQSGRHDRRRDDVVVTPLPSSAWHWWPRPAEGAREKFIRFQRGSTRFTCQRRSARFRPGSSSSP